MLSSLHRSLIRALLTNTVLCQECHWKRNRRRRCRSWTLSHNSWCANYTFMINRNYGTTIAGKARLCVLWLNIIGVRRTFDLAGKLGVDEAKI